MDKFQPGSIVYHKASNEKGVVIRINPDDTIRVQNSKNEEIDFSSYALETEDGRDRRNDNEFAKLGQNDDMMDFTS